MSKVDEPVPLCISCAAELPPGVHFCPKCNAPADAFAVWGPFETILTRGWGYRVAQRPRNFLVLFGVWLIWGPLLFGSCYGVLLFLVSLPDLIGRRGPGMQTERFFAIMTLLISSVGAYVCGTYLLRSTRYYLQHRHDPPPPDDEDNDDEDDPFPPSDEVPPSSSDA